MKSAADKLLLRPLAVTDAAPFQALRLEALQEAPDAFGSSFLEEHSLDLDSIAARIETRIDAHSGQGQAVFGAFDQGKLVGIVGLRRERLQKLRHKAQLWSMYVSPAYRGAGLGRLLLQMAVDFSRDLAGVRRINLTVNAANLPAMALYRALGFIEYGHEPQALCVADAYHDEKLMTLAV